MNPGYLRHSACYKKERGATGSCMSDFRVEVQRITLQEAYANYDEDGEYEGEYFSPEGAEEQDPEVVMCRLDLDHIAVMNANKRKNVQVFWGFPANSPFQRSTGTICCKAISFWLQFVFHEAWR